MKPPDQWFSENGHRDTSWKCAADRLPSRDALVYYRTALYRFAGYIDLYRRAAEQFGTTAHPVGMHSPGFIANTDEEARNLHWPHYRVIRDRIGALRGWPPIRQEEYEREIEHGSLYIGSPETVARKIADAVKALGVGRFDLIYTAGAQPISARMRAVELYGTKVIPMVHDILAG